MSITDPRPGGFPLLQPSRTAKRLFAESRPTNQTPMSVAPPICMTLGDLQYLHSSHQKDKHSIDAINSCSALTLTRSALLSTRFCRSVFRFDLRRPIHAFTLALLSESSLVSAPLSMIHAAGFSCCRPKDVGGRAFILFSFFLSSSLSLNIWQSTRTTATIHNKTWTFFLNCVVSPCHFLNRFPHQRNYLKSRCTEVFFFFCLFICLASGTFFGPDVANKDFQSPEVLLQLS